MTQTETAASNIVTLITDYNWIMTSWLITHHVLSIQARLKLERYRGAEVIIRRRTLLKIQRNINKDDKSRIWEGKTSD